MASINNISKFARDNGVPRQTVQSRLKAGWKFGVLDGDTVLYDPKSVMYNLESVQPEKLTSDPDGFKIAYNSI